MAMHGPTPRRRTNRQGPRSQRGRIEASAKAPATGRAARCQLFVSFATAQIAEESGSNAAGPSSPFPVPCQRWLLCTPRKIHETTAPCKRKAALALGITGAPAARLPMGKLPVGKLKSSAQADRLAGALLLGLTRCDGHLVGAGGTGFSLVGFRSPQGIDSRARCGAAPGCNRFPHRQRNPRWPRRA